MHSRAISFYFSHLCLCGYFFFFRFTYACAAAADGPVLNADASAFVNKVLSGSSSPGGVGIALVRRNTQGTWDVETKGYGVAKLASGEKVTENTLFAIGSNSKLFTVLATGLLIRNETITPPLSWTSKLSTVIPGFGLQDPISFKQANIMDAMSHRTGLPRHDWSFRKSDTVSSILNKVKNQRFSAEFREVFQYNNNMYAILSSLPTMLLPSKIPFARYVKQHILDPLGMTSTTYSSISADASGHLADGIARQVIHAGGEPFIPRSIPFWFSGGDDGNFVSGGGGVISNAVDMATWLQCLLLQGANPKTNVSVIPPDVVQTAATGVSIVSGVATFPEFSPLVYGGGQVRGTYRGYEFIGHDGSVPGFKSTIMRLPHENIGVAVLSNDEDFGNLIATAITYHLLDQALGLEPIDWFSRFKNVEDDSTPDTTPRPSNATFPYGKIASVAGNYYDAGYGPIELCLVSEPDPNASSNCQALSRNITTELPGILQPNVPTLVARYDSPFASHIRLSHFDKEKFNLTAFTSNPTGNVSVPFWTSEVTNGSLAYVSVDEHLSGLGFFGMWGAADTLPEREGKTVQERAEVWFERV